MLIFGHLGIGVTLARPFLKAKLPRSWFFAGALGPDLLDKPLYYGLSVLTHKHSAELADQTAGLIGGTRTFGHTGLALLILTVTAVLKKSKVLAALALGVATHLLLDNFEDVWMDYWRGFPPDSQPYGVALLWPLRGWRFPVLPYSNLSGHLDASSHPAVLVWEALGLLLLLWDFRQNSRSRRLSL